MASFQVADNFRQHYSQLRQALPQSLLLHGEIGVGLGAMAQQLAGKHARVLQPTDKNGEVDMDNGTISVAAIRQLYEQTRAKSTERQVIVIEHADQMSLGAQNAFLKLLEEPSQSIYFILTSYHQDGLLPTILSRVQSYHVPRISQLQSHQLLKACQLDENLQRQLMFVAVGRPGLLMRLGTDQQLRDQTIALMSDARDFLSASGYRALVIALKHASSRGQAEQFVDAVMSILQHTLYTAPSLPSLQRADSLQQTKLLLRSNANPKLQMMRLVVK